MAVLTDPSVFMVPPVAPPDLEPWLREQEAARQAALQAEVARRAPQSPAASTPERDLAKSAALAWQLRQNIPNDSLWQQFLNYETRGGFQTPRQKFFQRLNDEEAINRAILGGQADRSKMESNARLQPYTEEAQRLKQAEAIANLKLEADPKMRSIGIQSSAPFRALYEQDPAAAGEFMRGQGAEMVSSTPPESGIYTPVQTPDQQELVRKQTESRIETQNQMIEGRKNFLDSHPEIKSQLTTQEQNDFYMNGRLPLSRRSTPAPTQDQRSAEYIRRAMLLKILNQKSTDPERIAAAKIYVEASERAGLSVPTKIRTIAGSQQQITREGEHRVRQVRHETLMPE